MSSPLLLVPLLLVSLCGLLVSEATGESGIAFPDSPAKIENSAIARDGRSAVEEDYEDYEDEGSEGGPEARHFKRKLKRKFKPHKLGLGYGLFGCRKLHGCGGHGGWQQQQHYGGGPIAAVISAPSNGYGGWNSGYGGGLGGHGWNSGYGGGWNPGYGGGYHGGYYGGHGGGFGGGHGGGFGGGHGGGFGGGYARPGPAHSQAQAASWSFGPFQGSFGLAHAR